MAMPPRREKVWSDVEIAPEVEQSYEALLDRLRALGFNLEKKEPALHALTLAPDARAVWIKFYNEWAQQQAAAEGELAAALSKLEGYAARLALIRVPSR